MADSTLSITVRDTIHPCSPYESTAHTFIVQIFNCDGTPLFWKGIDYGRGLPLNTPGRKGGRIHAQLRVPPGCYLVRAIATCKNVVTDWAWVEVCCNQVVCLNLVPPSVKQCIDRVMVALHLGTIDPPEKGEELVSKAYPSEVKAAVEVLNQLSKKLPKDENLPHPPSHDEVTRTLEELAKNPPKASTHD